MAVLLACSLCKVSSEQVGYKMKINTASLRKVSCFMGGILVIHWLCFYGDNATY